MLFFISLLPLESSRSPFLSPSGYGSTLASLTHRDGSDSAVFLIFLLSLRFHVFSMAGDGSPIIFMGPAYSLSDSRSRYSSPHVTRIAVVHRRIRRPGAATSLARQSPGVQIHVKVIYASRRLRLNV